MKKYTLFEPVGNSQLVLFRIMFGLLLCFHCISEISNGIVYTIFIEPPFTFTFIGFEFLQPLRGNGMYYYFGLMAIFGLMIMMGAWYRIAMISFAVMWTILYLMQKSNYNNHYYLILLVCWLMAIMPANRAGSFDAWRNKKIRNACCARWIPLLFIAQMAIMYFFAGISKLYPDWMSGKFIEIRFSRLSMHPHLGFLYGNKIFQMLITYGGIVFDLFIIPLLLWKKTRNIALLSAVLFHLFNSYTFRIGIFPYLSIAMLVFFIDPEKLRSFFYRKEKCRLPDELYFTIGHKKLMLAFLFTWIIIQLVLPLRHLLYPGNVFWTEEGYRMSWKMMLRTKSGTVYFMVKDPQSGQLWKVEPAKHFKPLHMMWLSGSPDIIWQYAQRIKKDFTRKGFPSVEIYAIGQVSMNRQTPKPLVNAETDLAKIKWSHFKHANWIMPEPGK